MPSFFKSAKVWGLAAATAAATGVAGVFLGRFFKNIEGELNGYDRQELDLLREHVRQEGLTQCLDTNGLTLQRYDRQGKRHPICISELEDGRVQIEPILDESQSKTLQHTSYANKIISEKTTTAETNPAMVK